MALFGHRRHRRHNPRRHRRNPFRRHRYHRNPMSSLTSMIPMVLSGAAGAVAVKWLPKVLGLSSGLMYYGAQLGTIVGGGYLADKMISKPVSDGWIIGSAAILVTDLLSGVLSPLGLAGFAAFPAMGPALEAPQQYAGYGAMPSYHDNYAY